MAKFMYLIKAVKDENKARERETIAAIKELQSVDAIVAFDNRYHSVLTAANFKKPFAELKKIFIEKMRKYYEKTLARKIEKIQTVANSKPCDGVKISVQWTKGGAYGWQACAELWTYQNYYKGKRTGGCGYDKLSTATADALNLAPEVLYYLFDLENKRLAKVAKGAQLERRAFIGYGSGYGVIPYFEGGVGQSCINSILTKCGFDITHHSGKDYDIIFGSQKRK